jgi:hypothetical protein
MEIGTSVRLNARVIEKGWAAGEILGRRPKDFAGTLVFGLETLVF